MARAPLTRRVASTSPHFAVRKASVPCLVVIVYAIAMAYVESAAVLYLRTIYGGIDPVGPRNAVFDPLPDFVWIEIGREAATMLMLGTVGWLAGRGVAGRIGAFALAMGVWDTFYYVFLWLFAGWPASPFAPDVLFLIPLPWWGPVVSPVILAMVMAVAGAAAMARELGDGVPRPRLAVWLLVVAGASLCLIAFMADAIAALGRGLDAAYEVRAGPFPWPLYLLGLGLACIGLVRGLTAAAERIAALAPSGNEIVATGSHLGNDDDRRPGRPSLSNRAAAFAPSPFEPAGPPRGSDDDRRPGRPSLSASRNQHD